MRTRINKIPKRSLKEVHELITKNECRVDTISSGKNHRAVRKNPETGVRIELNFSSSSPRKLEEWIASNRIEHDRGDLQASDGSSAYAPVVKWDATRSVLALAIKHDLHSRQVDFLNAFAQANLPDGNTCVCAPSYRVLTCLWRNCSQTKEGLAWHG